MLKLEDILTLYEKGFSLLYLPPKSKSPKGIEYIGWTSRPNFTKEELINSFDENKNLAVRLGRFSQLDDEYCLIAIDFDVKSQATHEQRKQITQSLIELLGDPKIYPAVKSGSLNGSMHFYARCPLSWVPFNTNIFRESWGEIALKGEKSLIVLPPSIHPETNKPYEWARSLEQFMLPDITQFPIWEKILENRKIATETIHEERLVLTHDAELNNLNISQDTKDLIKFGDSSGKYATRSEILYACILRLVNAGVSDEAIVEILYNPEYSILYSCINERAKGSFEKAYSWLIPQINKAYRLQLSETQNEFLDLLIPESEKKTEEFNKILSLVDRGIEELEDIKKHPHSKWIIPGRFLERQITITAAPGGSGKSAYSIQEAIAIALNKDLGVGEIRRPGNVLIYNTEDDIEEIYRRIYAICKHFKIAPKEINNRLFLANTNNKRLILISAENGKKAHINLANIEHLKEQITKNNISVCIIDPLVKFHAINENDNSAMDNLAHIFTILSQQTNVSFNLIHHTKKPGNGISSAGDADAIRGASALVNAARIAHTFVGMSKKEAETLGIEVKQRKRFVRLDSAKQNLFLDLDEAVWFEKVSVCLENDPNQIESDWRCAFVPWNQPTTLIDGVTVKLADEILEFIDSKCKAEEYLLSNPSHPNFINPIIETRFNLQEQYVKSLLNYWKGTGQIELVVIDNYNKLKAYSVHKDKV